MRLLTEQREHCDSLDRRPWISAAAGCGKTTVAGAISAAVIRHMRQMEETGASSTERKRKLVWLVPTRSQRDDALKSLRALLEDPLSVMALGPRHQQF